jgi:hypothetical protein
MRDLSLERTHQVFYAVHLEAKTSFPDYQELLFFCGLDVITYKEHELDVNL